MAYPGSCSKHACIHVPPLQTTLFLIISGIALLASFMFAVAAEAPPGGYRFGLTHARDATTSTPRQGGAWTAKLHSSIREREYLMEVFVQGQKYLAIADTGSSLIWLKPPRQQVSSMTRDKHDPLLCSNSLLCPRPSCKCEGGRCSCDINYHDEFHTRVSMFQEKLSFDPPQELKDVPEKKEDIAIGWSEDTDTYNGTVGLGRGDQSLVNQLGVHTLSYCLATYNDKDDQKSKLLIGGSHHDLKKTACTSPPESKDHCKVNTTSLAKHTEFYLVQLESIKIGSWSSEKAIVFIDSGASWTILEKTAYEKLVDHVDQAMPEEAKNKKEDYGFTVCWPDDPDAKKLGELELHFTGAVMYLDKHKILYDDLYDEHGHKRDHKRVCLAMKPSGPGEKLPAGASVVLGNYQQQNVHMHFDMGKNELSFVNANDCTDA